MADQLPTKGEHEERTHRQEAAAMIAALERAKEAAQAVHPEDKDIQDLFNGITEAYCCDNCDYAAPASLMMWVNGEADHYCVWCVVSPDVEVKEVA